MEEEVLRIDRKKAKEEGYEYWFEIEDDPVTRFRDTSTDFLPMGRFWVIKRRKVVSR